MSLIMKTTTDLQRNIGEVTTLCRESRQPVYITKNGDVDLVIMDAKAFEDAMELRDLAYEREMRTLAAIKQGRDEIRQGFGRPYREVREEMGFS